MFLELFLRECHRVTLRPSVCLPRVLQPRSRLAASRARLLLLLVLPRRLDPRDAFDLRRAAARRSGAHDIVKDVRGSESNCEHDSRNM